MRELAVEFHGVAKNFATVSAVDGLDLSLRRGETVAPLGANGAAANGLTAPDIARTLHLSEGTVRNYLSSAIQKTGARNRVEPPARPRTTAGCEA